jgi:hypothetical protein
MALACTGSASALADPPKANDSPAGGGGVDELHKPRRN